MGPARLVYVLLDGVGDLPHPDLGGLTPLAAARTPSLDRLASRGSSGRVVTVGEGIAPESDIAVFNMLGYSFAHADYAGRGVIEAIGIGMDFRDGDLALRGNYATVEGGVITDRRAGRRIARADAEGIAREVEGGLSIPGVEAAVAPTVGHRVTVRIRAGSALSPRITNTDPAYSNVGGMGVAKAVGDLMRVERCLPLEEGAAESARIVNEFSGRAMEIMAASGINARRAGRGEKALGCILLRDAGSRRPAAQPISERYGMPFSCVVDMSVEVGIARVLGMRALRAGGLADYGEKARAAAAAVREPGAVYVHLKGPDEFGHDGDAEGKRGSIEEIDAGFFGPLLDSVDDGVAVVVSADHSTPCISKGHSDDPVPLVVSGGAAPRDGTTRMTEEQAASGSIGTIRGAEVLSRALGMVRSQSA